MANPYRQLKPILWKHRKVRTRHWLLTLLEVIIPIVIFVSIAYARSKLPQFDKEYKNASYIDPLTDELLSTALNVRDTKIFFAPKTEFTDKLIREVQLKLHLYNEAIKGFRNRDDIMRYYREIGDEGITIVIIFDDVGHVIPKVLKYDIQMYEEMIYWETDKLFRHDILYMPGVGSERYIGQQFIPTQWALETSFIEMVNKTALSTTMTFQEFPYPPHWTDSGMINVFSYLLPLLVILSFTFLFPSILRLVVMEKSSGIKQLMKINGLKSWAYWFGWFVNGFSICVFSVIAIVFLLTSKLFHDDFAPLQHADIGQLTVLLLLYCSATISFIFAFSTLFKKALLAMISGIIFWFVVYITFIAIATNMEVISLDMKVLMSLLPNIALYYGIGILSDGEIRGDTVGWTELSRNSNDDMTMVNVVMVLAFDTIFYIFLAWAFDTDPTGKYKISACCKKSNKDLIYLLKERVFGKLRANNNMKTTNEEKVSLNVKKNIEDNEKGRVLLEIRNLRKTYGQVVALKDLDMDIYSGTLTAMLGHNGAGKTTTMSILAGLTEETCGSILLTESDEVDLKNRQYVSICPQENLLLPDLTVKEHLQFFGLLKGLTFDEVNTEIETLLTNRLNLYEKRHELVKNLSGGMKRKLAIGIAVMGKPRLLILDEPTAGIDPEGRRVIWDLISALKSYTTILMSTHLMEEAEELADRVAIIDDGELECYGTPFYLKDQYNVGFHFTVDVTEETRKDVRTLVRTFSDIEPVDKPNLLEYNFQHSDKEGVLKMLEDIENKITSPPIPDCKLSTLMLEDIFHKIRKNKESQAAKRDMAAKIDMSSFGSSNKTCSSLSDKKTPTPEESCFVHFCRKFEILAIKKFLFLKNTLLKWIPIVAIFYLLVLLTFALGNKGFKDVSQDGKTLKLQLGTYGSQHIYYRISENSELQRIYESMVNMRGISAINTENVSERILERGERNLAEYKTNLIVASEFTTEDGVLTHINVMYANQAVHGAPISLNLATNTLIKLIAGDEYSIIGSNTPLRSVNTKKQNVAQSQYDNLLLWTTMLPLGALFPAIISLLLPTIERNNFVKTMSLIYQIRSVCYWLSSYILDLCTYVIIIIPVIFVLWMASLVGLLSLEYIAIVMFLVIFMLYGITIIPVTYLISTYSKSVASACASFLVPNMCISTIFVGVVLTLEMGDDGLADKMRLIFALNPHFTFSYLLSKFCMKMVANHNWDIKTEHQIQMMCEEKPRPCCIPDSDICAAERAYINWDYYMILTCVAAITCLLLVIFLDSDLWKRIKAMEFKTSKLPPSDESIIRANGVVKSYKIGWRFKDFFAVKKLTFEVKKHDCFALLGVNGAGKSTTFRMITKQEVETGGTWDIKSEKIGYCPQDHALIGDLTGKQLLKYFAQLQNYDTSETEIDQLLEDCGLSQIANRLCKTYSGGNKRKLNTCIALIGNPEIIALDEPTTGVDPGSRWKIQELIKNAKVNSAIVFTSHSMDECERLCDNVGIMKEGEIANDRQAIGELKEDYAVGHILRIKLKPQDDQITKDHYKTQVKRVLEEDLENVEVLDDRSDVITACVKRKSWTELLTTMQKHKGDEKMGIQDYILQESSLEHVFLTIAKHNKTNEHIM